MARRKSVTRRKGVRRGRGVSKGFDTKLIMDVGLAGIATRLIPSLVNKFFPIDPSIYTFVGAGGGYLAGHFLKKPVLANAAIALGIVELVTPMIDNLIGGVTGSSPMLPTGKVNLLPSKIVNKQAVPPTTVSDYFNLNDYIGNPSVQSFDAYKDSY